MSILWSQSRTRASFPEQGQPDRDMMPAGVQDYDPKRAARGRSRFGSHSGWGGSPVRAAGPL